MIPSVISIPLLMWWMYNKQAMLAYKWFGILLLPLSLLALIWWMYVKREILQDIKHVHNKELLRNGIPHHGMLIVVGSQFACAWTWIVQVVVTVNEYEYRCNCFGIANITNFMLIGIIKLICRVERSFLALSCRPTPSAQDK
jgi:hypothetical protein